VYSDFLLHSVESRPEGGGGSYRNQGPVPDEVLPIEGPRPDEWKTPPLWGVADSAPYFHDGGSPTLQAAILRHGGEAAAATEAYRKLPAADRQALIAFLHTLRAPPEAEAATGSALVSQR
jgi:CxxC motif-containing protein (DUF1111 family)